MHARNRRLSAWGDWLIFHSRLTSLICFLSPLLAEQLASSQSTQGHLIINQRKTLLGKVNCRVCVWVLCGHFLDYLAVLVCCLPLWAPAPLCLWRYRQGDSDQQWIPKSSWKLSPPRVCVGMLVSCRGLMCTSRGDWPWPLSGLRICDQEKVQCLCLVMVLRRAVSRENFTGADGPGLQEPSWLCSQRF